MNPGNLFRNASIRRKQVAIIMVTSSVALALACASFGLYDYHSVRRELAERLASFAEVVGHNTTAALVFLDPTVAEETLTGLRGEPNIVFAAVFTPDGRLFARYLKAGAPASVPTTLAAIGEGFGRDYFGIARPVLLQGENIGTIALVSDLGELTDRWERYALIIVVVFFASLLVSFALSARLHRFISDPILDLARLARSVAVERNYAVRAARGRDDELGQLIDGFNDMLAQIELRDEQLRAIHATLERRVEERTAALQEAQTEIARDRARFRFIFESVPVGISFFVGHDNTHLVNPAHERITGVSAEDSRKPGAFIRVSHADDYARQQELRKRMDRGEIDHFSLEKRYLRPDGSVVWAVFTSRMFTDPATGERQAVTTVVDITELKHSEAALAYERDLLRALLETCPDSIFFKDRESRFIRCSASMANGFHVARADDLVGRSDFDFFAAATAQQTFDDEQQIIRTGRPLDSKIERCTWQDGRIGWALTSKTALRNMAGEVIGTIGTSKDITEIKEAEAKLEVAHRQLLESTRLAGMAEVATGVLHNVGNVLNSVNVSATLASDQVRESQLGQLTRVCALLREHAADLGDFLTRDPKGCRVPQFLETLAEHLAGEQQVVGTELESLRKNVEHIKEIVAMQQTYSKVSGLSETIVVADLVEDTLRINDAALARHHVRPVRDYQDRSAVSVEKHKVLQILVNLVRNAIHACDDSGRSDKQITVRVAAVDGSRIQISVADNGVGIPKENLTRIFSHGFTTRRDGHGFGLHSGALVAKELGGSLRADSAGPGHGATFTLELPIHKETRPA